MGKENQRPEWVPDDADASYTTHVMPGVTGGHDGMGEGSQNPPSTPPPASRRKRKSVEDYVKGVLEFNRTILAQTITLVESNHPTHAETAQEVIKQLLPHTGRSIRIGITGVPGAGKSTFIEALGIHLCKLGHRVAVLAVDPSSSITKGSILGDKTRMEELSRHANAFIRPSASGGTLGGVAKKTRETMMVCEAAGYDVILIETVGVGQSEVTVRAMVDFFLLLQITGAGDELQGMKKGVMELADAILINKADGDNKQRAKNAQAEYNQILHVLKPATEGWTTEAYTCSSVTGEGIDDIWQVVQDFKQRTTDSGAFERRRQNQMLEWMHALIQDYLKKSFYEHPGVKESLPAMERDVQNGNISPAKAVQELIHTFESLKII